MFVFTHLLFAAFIVCVASLLAPPLRLLVPACGRGGGGLWLFGTTVTEVQAIPLANLEGVFKAMEFGVWKCCCSQWSQFVFWHQVDVISM